MPVSLRVSQERPHTKPHPVGHTGTIRDLKFCPKFNVLVSCGFDKTVQVWQ